MIGCGLSLTTVALTRAGLGGGPAAPSGPVFDPNSPSFSTDMTLGVLDGSIVFTRGSTGYYFNAAGTMVSQAANTARFDHTFLTGAANLGLLMEESSKNWALRNSALGNAAWVKTNMAANSNNQTGLDGTASYANVAASAANGTILQPITGLTASSPYTFSIDLKRLSGVGTVAITADGATFQGAIITANYARYSVTANSNVGGGLTVGIRISTNADSVAAGSAQLEAGNYATSRIDTAGTTSTRSADAAQINSPAWVTNGENCTVYVEAMAANFAPSGTTRFFILSDSTSNNRIQLGADKNGNIQGTVSKTGTDYTTPNGATLGINVTAKMALSYTQGGNLSLSVNGGAVVSVTGIVPAQTANWSLANLGPSNVGGDVWLRKVKYFKGAANSAQLVTLST